MNRIFLILTVLAAAVLSAAGQQTKVLTADRYNDYGLVYTLPLTRICVEIDVLRTVRHAGPFAQYAKKYLGMTDPISEDAVIWQIGAVRLRSFGSPDTLAYQMQIKPGLPTSICVDSDGMILAINSTADAQASLPKANLTPAPDDYNSEAYLKYVNEDFLASQSSAKRAQILSESLLEIRDSRLSLTRGTAETMPVDGKQLELMLDDLSKQEAALTAAFAGAESSEKLTGVFTFTPADDGRFVLTRLSDAYGFVGADDYSGEPVRITVSTTREGDIPLDNKGELMKMPKDGVAYCIPGAARIEIDFKGKKLASEEFDIAQYGVVFGLNPQLFTDKKQPSYATFDPTTGALVELGSVQSIQ